VRLEINIEMKVYVFVLETLSAGSPIPTSSVEALSQLHLTNTVIYIVVQTLNKHFTDNNV